MIITDPKGKGDVMESTYKIVFESGKMFEGTAEQIVTQLRNTSMMRRESSVEQFMVEFSDTMYGFTGIRVPTSSFTEFVEGIAEYPILKSFQCTFSDGDKSEVKKS